MTKLPIVLERNKLYKLLEELNPTSTILAITPDNKIFDLFKHYGVVDHICKTGYDFVYLDCESSYNLEEIWKSVNYNSFLYIHNHFGHKQVTEFLKNKKSEIIISRAMQVNGNTEPFLIVKCYPLHLTPIQTFNMNDNPLVITTVLKSGGIYTPDYVNKLANAINRNLSIPYKFVCLTDLSNDVFNENVHKIIPFAQNYPKWWGKVELFREGLFYNSRVVYFDLDTLIIDNINFIYSFSESFCALRDFYHMVTMGSGFMMWDGDDKRLQTIYTDFITNSEFIISSYKGGDQEWINQQVRRYLKYVQDYYPGKIVSFKKDCFSTNNIVFPENAAIVCFHGPPRMHELVNYPELDKHWY